MSDTPEPPTLTYSRLRDDPDYVPVVAKPPPPSITVQGMGVMGIGVHLAQAAARYAINLAELRAVPIKERRKARREITAVRRVLREWARALDAVSREEWAASRLARAAPSDETAPG